MVVLFSPFGPKERVQNFADLCSEWTPVVLNSTLVVSYVRLVVQLAPGSAESDPTVGRLLESDTD